MTDELRRRDTSDTSDISVFRCLSDNYGYLIHDPTTGAIASIDAPEAGPITAALEKRGWKLTDILVTHHHHDHIGGIAELKQKYQCRVIAPHDRLAAIPLVDQRVKDGDLVKIGALAARVLETPGHTLDHVSYLFESERALFAADTLFSIGCGRVIEGNAAMMWQSILKLRALPDDIRLYCGHEYTLANIKFALTIEPDNAALRVRAAEAAKQRKAGKPTVPTLMGEEKQANVFLRADVPAVAAKVGLSGKDPAQVFGEISERKNKFWSASSIWTKLKESLRLC